MISTNKKSIIFMPYIILIILFFINLLTTWPGSMTPDSFTQYYIAQSQIYSDHHPALMSFVWHYLDIIYQGPGLMLAFHLLLLYGAAAYGVSIFINCWMAYLFVALPLLPIVIIYSFKIWKDVGFAFSFLIASMMLSHAIAKQRPLYLIEQLSFWLILFYGTCVKFQAQYCAPIIIVFYVIHHSQFFANNLSKILIAFGVIIGTFYGGFFYVNNILVPPEQKNNSWQYVKMYDLAAISFDSGTMYMPKFLYTKHFTTEKFLATFNHQSVDNIVLVKDSIFRSALNSQELNNLWWQWAKTVISHPLPYMKHRSINMGYSLLSLPEFNCVKDFLDNSFDINSIQYKTLYYTARLISYFLVGHILIAIVSMAYLYLGIITLKATWAAFPLIMLNSVNFMIISTLFFCSMAGTPRYTYIVACLTSASHAFAWVCFQHHLSLGRICGNKMTSRIEL